MFASVNVIKFLMMLSNNTKYKLFILYYLIATNKTFICGDIYATHYKHMGVYGILKKNQGGGVEAEN